MASYCRAIAQTSSRRHRLYHAARILPPPSCRHGGCSHRIIDMACTPSILCSASGLLATRSGADSPFLVLPIPTHFELPRQGTRSQRSRQSYAVVLVHPRDVCPTVDFQRLQRSIFSRQSNINPRILLQDPGSKYRTAGGWLCKPCKRDSMDLALDGDVHPRFPGWSPF